MPVRILLGLLPLLAILGCARAQGEEEAPAYPFVLSAEEVREARSLAENHVHIEPRPLSPVDRIHFIKAELLPDSQAKSSQRLVLVVHYRYRDDETIHTMVDLVHHQVIKVDKFHHFPTALAREEVQRAEELARRDERLKALLEASRPAVKLQARPIQFTQPEPLFGRRVVQLLLLRGEEYLRTPQVFIDLTTETVHLDQ